MAGDVGVSHWFGDVAMARSDPAAVAADDRSRLRAASTRQLGRDCLAVTAIAPGRGSSVASTTSSAQGPSAPNGRPVGPRCRAHGSGDAQVGRSGRPNPALTSSQIRTATEHSWTWLMPTHARPPFWNIRAALCGAPLWRSQSAVPASVLRRGRGPQLILLGSGPASDGRALCLSPRAAGKTVFAGSCVDEVDWVGQVVAVDERALGA
jgi:hypothetical protein